jgi:hypothetical protein
MKVSKSDTSSLKEGCPKLYIFHMVLINVFERNYLLNPQVRENKANQILGIYILFVSLPI